MSSLESHLSMNKSSKYTLRYQWSMLTEWTNYSDLKYPLQ